MKFGGQMMPLKERRCGNSQSHSYNHFKMVDVQTSEADAIAVMV
jgi:hypothetical protein